MKRLTAILISVLILISSNVVFADTIDDLRSINALPYNFDAVTEEYITRAEFAYMTAKILSREECAPQETIFADVTSDNEYSGYIDYLADRNIISGVDGAIFNPDVYIDTNAANKILISTLGYKNIAEKIGGYPEGYNKLAWDLSLYDGVTVSYNKLTKANAAQIVHNALLADVFDEYSQSGKRPLCDYLNISAYKGIFTDTDISSNSGEFLVRKNVYDENNEKLSVGEEHIFYMVRTENITQYEQVPATIWVDSDEKIVNIIPDKQIKVLYGYGYSVNGDNNVDSFYLPDEINSFSFVGDEEEYDVLSGLKVKYNNKYTDSHVKLCGEFIKAVLINDEITFIECFDVKEGGIITKKSSYEFSYTQGDAGMKKIQNILLKKSLHVFIDNKPSDYKDLEVGDVFDYYETDTELTIVATQNVKIGIFIEYSNGKNVNVGGMYYDINGKMYLSEDALYYDTAADITKFLNKNVTLYLSPSGYARYMTVSDDVIYDEFYGVIIGMNTSLFGDNAEIRLYKIDGESIEEKVYTTKENVRFNGISGNGTEGKLLAIKESVGGKLQGDSLYLFTLNDKEEISSISAPTAFYGTNGESANLTAFSSTSTLNVTVGDTAVRVSGNTPLIHLYETENRFGIRALKLESLDGLTGSGLTIKFYGAEKTEFPELYLVTGSLENYSPLSTTIDYGFYTGVKSIVLGEDGNEYRSISIIQGSIEKTFLLSDSFFADTNNSLPAGPAIVKYTTNRLVCGDNSIKILGIIHNFSSPQDEWLNENGDSLQRGVIEKIVGNRVYLTDGKSYIFPTSESKRIFVKYSVSAKNRFNPIDKDDIFAGDLVYYNLSGGRIEGIIVVK